MGRPHPEEIGIAGEDLRFVHGYPKLNIVSKFLGELSGIARNIFWEIFGARSALSGEPEGQSKMPDSEEWFEFTFAHRADHCAIMI